MADMWFGICGTSFVEKVREALLHLDTQATLRIVSTPQELRERVCEAPFRCGAIVGPLDGTMSAINVAAAVVRDGMAADVALVLPSLTQGVAKRAERAGIRTVIDLSALEPESLHDLDEPELVSDDIPTMVISALAPAPASARVPRVDEDPEPDMLTLPLVREGEHGPRVEQVRVPRDSVEQVRDDAARPRDASPQEAVPIGRDCSQPVPPAPNADRAPERPHAPRTAHEDARTGARAPIITFVSGRGGVGKTTLVAIMAALAESWGMRVALCDLDLSCGNLYSFFGVGGGADLTCLSEDAKDAHTILDAGKHIAKNLVLWGPCEKPEMAEVVYPQVGDLLDVLAQSADLVLVDTSSTFTDAVAQAAQQCDRLVIVVDSRPGAAVAQTRVAALAVRLGIARTRLARLANRCGPHGRGEPVINRADKGLETARPLRVLDGGAEVSDTLAEGRVHELVDLGSRCVDSSATALAILLSELGALPDHPDAQRAYERRQERSRWSFGRRHEAV